MIERVELRAIRIARSHFEALGFAVEDVTKDRRHRGYDFLLREGTTTETVEVKGCTRDWHIPDLFSSEVVDGQLVADKLCVIYFIDALPPKVCVIPRDAIPREYFKEKRGYRISSKLKKESHLGRYVQPFAGRPKPVDPS